MGLQTDCTKFVVMDVRRRCCGFYSVVMSKFMATNAISMEVSLEKHDCAYNVLKCQKKMSEKGMLVGSWAEQSN